MIWSRGFRLGFGRFFEGFRLVTWWNQRYAERPDLITQRESRAGTGTTRAASTGRDRVESRAPRVYIQKPLKDCRWQASHPKRYPMLRFWKALESIFQLIPPATLCWASLWSSSFLSQLFRWHMSVFSKMTMTGGDWFVGCFWCFGMVFPCVCSFQFFWNQNLLSWSFLHVYSTWPWNDLLVWDLFGSGRLLRTRNTTINHANTSENQHESRFHHRGTQDNWQQDQTTDYESWST